MSDETKAAERTKEANPVTKLAIDLGPLVSFFVVYFVVERYRPGSGFYWATGVLMVASVVSLGASRLLLGRLSMPTIVTAALILTFGTITIWLQDPRFVMVKPTLINLLFAGILGFGLVTGRPLLKLLMGEALRLTDEGWYKLTMRWVIFFVSMALTNEIVWRNFSEPTWVTFKVWGILPLTFAFAVVQVGLIRRHQAKADA